jgi:hypothetical protein
MPAKALWLSHIPEIVAQLEALEVPVVDRAMIKRLFGLHRRGAIEVLYTFGGYQVGRTFVMDRLAFIRSLQGMLRDEEFDREYRRRQRLGAALEELRQERAASAVRIPAAPNGINRRLRDLPEGIVIEPGRLAIVFASTQELLAKLYELARVVALRVDSCEERRAVRQPSAPRYAATSGAATVARSGSPPNKAA